ncbi:hypothetical protein BC826DRAFT_1189624 [Russula brevipes]|nr:hypothetical protein BC826DRAFT_1189624 [Russula brevipes]
MSTQMLSRRLPLPNEVLLEILSYLCPRDVAACQRSCRQLNDLVVCSQLLQYLLRIGRSGLHDPMLPGYTIPQRIEALERLEAAWRNLEARGSCQVKRIVFCEPPEEPKSTYIIRDDFLIATCKTTGQSDINSGYGYVDLRVFQPGGETDPWTRVINDNWSLKRSTFQFFPEQDLVVATFWSTDSPPSTLVELHGFSFSRGSPHPRFVSATITTTEVPRSVDVTIVGDHTILNVASRTTMSLFLHSWKDGRVSQLRHPSKQAHLRTRDRLQERAFVGRAPPHRAKRARWWCCAALSHDTFALVENDSATLEVCRIEEPDSDTPSLRTLVLLGSPPLASRARISSSYYISEQMPVYSGAPSFVVEDRPPRRHPFYSSPEDRIVAIAFRVKPYRDNDIRTRSFAIVTRLRTLIARATTTLPQGNFIPWKDWGPSGAACFERHIGSMSDVCVVGERLATLSPEELSIFDFNPTRVQNTIRKARHPSQDAVYSVVKDRVVIPRERLFKKDVVSELPYVSVTVPRPTYWWRLHNYEEVLAGSSMSANDEHERNEFYIYTTG